MELVIGDDGNARCWWGTASDDYAAYHDQEWGFGSPTTTDSSRRIACSVCCAFL